MANTKTCPFCAEDIKFEAKKCKHCGEFLNDIKPEAVPVKQAINKGNGIFYQDKDVMISSTRLMFCGKTYSTSNITSVAPYKENKAGCGLLCLAFDILCFLIMLGGKDIPTFLTFALFSIGIGIFFLQPVYSLQIKSSSSEEKVYKSDKKRIFAIVDAINQAIEARG